jgi:enoyl-CoA hydratase/carnithine racemase
MVNGTILWHRAHKTPTALIGDWRVAPARSVEVVETQKKGGTITVADNIDQQVLYEKQGRLRIMTLNRPEKMNALTPEGLEQQSRYLADFADDDDAWLLIITGRGKAFSTGLDLGAANQAVGRQKRAPGLTGHNPMTIWKPIIAALNGYVLGGGLELALACDIRIAADDARLGFPEVKRSLIPGTGGCQRLPRTVALGTALWMLFTGDTIDAQEAWRIGLVQHVVPKEKLLDEAVSLGERICENGPLAVRTIKEAVYRGLEMTLSAALVQDNLLAFRNRQTRDAEEGIRAFREKRRPHFEGR